MFDESWKKSFRAVMTRAVKVLGARGVLLWLNHGEVYDISGLSGKSLTEMLGSAGGIATVMSLLDSLEAGDAVPIVLMDRHAPGELSKLQLIDGALWEVLPGGEREPVDLTRNGMYSEPAR